MNELLFEILVAITAFVILWTLCSAIIKNNVESQPGSRLLITGFVLIFVSALIDITDNFPSLNKYVFIGNTPTEALIEKGIGSLLGLIILAVGFHRWLPVVLQLAIAKNNFKKLNDKLEKLVDERTNELSMVNQQLRQEMIEREKAQNKLDKQMLQDPLTDLPNRYALLEYLEYERLHNSTISNTNAMFIIDLDQFKTVNDSLGHANGDKVIKAIAKRLAFNHHSDSFLGRLGGDEFVLVMSMDNNDSQSAALQTYNHATALIELIATQLKVDSHQFNLSASIGITVFDYNTRHSSEDILRQADIALYNAKEKGLGAFSFFQPEMQQKAQIRLDDTEELHNALAHKELFLQYQPQVDSHGKLIGMEALLRWNHPVNGIVSPSKFIALGEEIGIIDKLGRYILHMACQQCSELASGAYPDRKLKIAINISPSHFLQDNFVEQIKSITEQYMLDNIQLVLEITEEVMINDIDDVIKKMNQLRRYNIHCSLDDFGTGYSSLTYLKKLPIDTVKIDKSFIQELHENKDDASIVEAILTMTRALEIDVIAEGIENTSQYDFLLALDCQYYQGYLFGKPNSISALIESDDLIDKRIIS